MSHSYLYPEGRCILILPSRRETLSLAQHPASRSARGVSQMEIAGHATTLSYISRAYENLLSRADVAYDHLGQAYSPVGVPVAG